MRGKDFSTSTKNESVRFDTSSPIPTTYSESDASHRYTFSTTEDEV
jgi:hypothetical protein